jgi:hypothetical protein
MTGKIEVKDIKINEDGGATYTFDLDEKASGLAQEEGLKLLLYCGLTKVDLDDVYNWILDQDKTPPKAPESI